MMTRPIIDTERLHLRILTTHDIPTLYELITKNPEISDNMTWNPPKSLAEAHGKFLSTKEEEDLNFGVFLGDTLIGRITMRNFRWLQQDSEKNSCFLSFWIAPDFGGKGYGKEMLAAVCQYGFETLKLRKIFAGIFAQNTVSEGLLTRVGFVRVGLLRKQYVKNGIAYDSIRFELLSEDLKV